MLRRAKIVKRSREMKRKQTGNSRNSSRDDMDARGEEACEKLCNAKLHRIGRRRLCASRGHLASSIFSSCCGASRKTWAAKGNYFWCFRRCTLCLRQQNQAFCVLIGQPMFPAPTGRLMGDLVWSVRRQRGSVLPAAWNPGKQK